MLLPRICAAMATSRRKSGASTFAASTKRRSAVRAATTVPRPGSIANSTPPTWAASSICRSWCCGALRAASASGLPREYLARVARLALATLKKSESETAALREQVKMILCEALPGKKANHLMTNFEQVSDVMEVIPCLRRFILDLAVRGKLVAQDLNDEPATELLKRTAAARARDAKKDKPLPPILENALPFELPSGWAWERLGNIGETNIGLTYSPQEVGDVGTPVLRSSNIQNGKLDSSDLVRVKKTLKSSVMVKLGDLLICARNGSRALVGKVAIIEDMPEPAAFGAFMAIFRSEFNKYIYNFISSPLFRQVISDVNTTTINQITQSNLRSTIVPVPPVAEQQRIVAKVEELMTLCDRWEASSTTSTDTRRGLLGALLNEALLPPEARDEAA
jgi:type I restriction enzyme S subunit